MSSMLFFFFKQKTAYEMRISDWSSDVCSSDLQQHHQDQKEAGDADPAARITRGDDVDLDDDREVHIPTRVRSQPKAKLSFFTRQIGRASCRDSVGQYV